MVVVMQEGASEDSIQNVINKLMDMGFDIHRSTGARHTVLGAVGAKVDFDTRNIELLEGVEEVLRITAPYKLASRHFRPEGTLVVLDHGVTIGGDEVVVMAGPCSVESAEQIDCVAASVAASGARILRGGAFKPRTSPYSFQGMGQKALELMREAADKYELCVVSGDGPHADPDDAGLRPHASGGRAQHAELQPAARTREGAQTHVLKRKIPPPLRNCCSPRNTSWPAVTTTWCCAKAAFAPSTAICATP